MVCPPPQIKWSKNILGKRKSPKNDPKNSPKKIVQGSKGPVHILSNDCNVINDNKIIVLLDFMLIFVITIIIITIIIIIFISTREM